MSRVPSIPRKIDPLDEIEAMLNIPEDQRRDEQAAFIREELARIGNQIDRAKPPGSKGTVR